jgi:hypothetical protein
MTTNAPTSSNTPLMAADDMAMAFNTTAERNRWIARVAGTRTVPHVKFSSTTNMIDLFYYPQSGRFAVTFSKATCAWGDFMASTRAALATVLQALKAAGYEVTAPLDDKDGMLRVEFDPGTKQTYVSLAKLDDDWREYAEIAFKELPAVL